MRLAGRWRKLAARLGYALMPSVPRRFLLALALLVGLAVPAVAGNPFGVAIWPSPTVDPTLLFARLRGMGTAWLRMPTAYLGSWDGNCGYCAAYANTGFATALVVRATAASRAFEPTPPPSDLAGVARTLGDVLDAWRPNLVVVEEREDDPAFYGGGDAFVKLYGAELAAACAVAHARHLYCANGGLSADAAWWLGWRGLLGQGGDVACDFARRGPGAGTDPVLAARLCAVKSASDIPADLRARLFGRAWDLFDAYGAAGIDALDFEWHASDARGLGQLAASLAGQIGKPVISIDFGPRPHETDPNAVRPLLRAAFAANLQLAMWDNGNPDLGMPLFAPDGTLTTAGWEFQRQMSGLK